MLDEYQVTFNGNRIDLVPGVDLYNYDFTRLPNRDIKIHKLARRSKSIVTSSEYTDKQIPIWADVCSGTRYDTESTIRDLKALIQAQNGLLVSRQGNLEVQYVATMNEFEIEWDGAHAYITIGFLASTPIGVSTSPQNLANITGNTLSSASATFNVQGSANAEPLITIVINSVTGGTGASIDVFNARTNQGISITANFVAGDIIQIDSDNLVATRNGARIDFTGIFPTFPPGSQQMGYSDTFTTRSIDLQATYTQRVI